MRDSTPALCDEHDSVLRASNLLFDCGMIAETTAMNDSFMQPAAANAKRILAALNASPKLTLLDG